MAPACSRLRFHVRLPAVLAAGVIAYWATTAVAVEEELEWVRQFGTAGSDGSFGVSATPTAIYVGGEIAGALPGQTSLGGSDAFLRKYDASGAEVWTRQFGTAGDDGAGGVIATSSGIYATGWTEGALRRRNAGNADAFLRKYNAAGQALWTRQFGTAASDGGWAVAANATGVHVAGWTGADGFVAKYDAMGNAIWRRLVRTDAADFPAGIAATRSRVYVAGQTDGTLRGQTSSGGRDAFLRAYDANGNVLWTRQFGTAVRDQADAVAATSSAVYVVGLAEGTLPDATPTGGLDAFIRKYNRDGEVEWTRQFADVAVGVSAGLSGVYVTGWMINEALPGETAFGSQDAFLRKYDFDGNVIWTRQFGTNEADEGWAVSPSASGVYLVGRTRAALPDQESAGDWDAYLTKFVSYRSDGLISLERGANYVGDGVYNSSGEGQSAGTTLAFGERRTFYIRAQNDGDATDTLRVVGCGDAEGFSVRYLAGLRGTTDITSQVVNGTYSLTGVAPAAKKSLRAVITAVSDVSLPSYECQVVVFSAQTGIEDVVKATVSRE